MFSFLSYKLLNMTKPKVNPRWTSVDIHPSLTKSTQTLSMFFPQCMHPPMSELSKLLLQWVEAGELFCPSSGGQCVVRWICLQALLVALANGSVQKQVYGDALRAARRSWQFWHRTYGRSATLWSGSWRSARRHLRWYSMPLCGQLH